MHLNGATDFRNEAFTRVHIHLSHALGSLFSIINNLIAKIGLFHAVFWSSCDLYQMCFAKGQAAGARPVMLATFHQ